MSRRVNLAPAVAVRGGRRRGVEAPDAPKAFCELGRFTRGCQQPIARRLAGVGICRRHWRRVLRIAREAGAQ